jgi:hypothetical protein
MLRPRPGSHGYGTAAVEIIRFAQIRSAADPTLRKREIMPDARRQFVLPAADPFVYAAASRIPDDPDRTVTSAAAQPPAASSRRTCGDGAWVTRRRNMRPVGREPGEPKAETLHRIVEMTHRADDPSVSSGCVVGPADADGAATLGHRVGYHLDVFITSSDCARLAIDDQDAGVRMVLFGGSDAADVAHQFLMPRTRGSGPAIALPDSATRRSGRCHGPAQAAVSRSPVSAHRSSRPAPRTAWT